MNFWNKSIENQRTAAYTESVALTGRTTFEKTLGKLTKDFFRILGIVGISVGASAAVYEGASALGIQRDLTGGGGSLAKGEALNSNIDVKYIIQGGGEVEVKGIDRNFGFDDKIGSGIIGNNAVMEGKIRSDLESNGHDVVATMAVQLVANAEGRPGEWGQNLNSRNIGLAFTADGSMWALEKVDEFGVARGMTNTEIDDPSVMTGTIKLDARYATTESKDKIIFGADGVDMFSILIGPDGSKSIAAIDTISGNEVNCSAVKVDAVLRNVNVTPTPPISPELIAMQDEIAKTRKLIFNTKTRELEWSRQVYKGLKYNDTENNWNLTLSDGTVVELAPDEVSISDEYGFSANGYSYDAVKGWGIVESDLMLVENAGTKLENYVYKGVTINGGYLLDQSLLDGSPRISDLKFRPEAVAELIARTVFADWWSHGPKAEEHKGKTPTDADFNSFMQLWSKAQKGDPSVSCADLEVDSYSNDLATDGYKQNLVKKRYLCDDGKAEPGTVVLHSLNVVAVNNGDYETIENITNVGKWFGVGFGENYQRDEMYWYVGLGFGAAAEGNNPAVIASVSSSLPKFVSINKGASYVADYKYNKDLAAKLESGLVVGK